LWGAYYNGKPMTKERIARVRAFVFDLDGTLINSKMDLVHSVNAMLRKTGRAELPTELVASYIGYGVPQLISSALGPGANEEQLREAIAVFLAHYDKHKLDQTQAYPGVADGLHALAGYPMAVLSNKPAKMSLEILEGLKLAKFFRFAYGGDSFDTKKPDPAGALAILKELRVSPGESAMVGDSDVDVQTARNAGMLAVHVRYGFGQHDREKQPADVYVDNLTELLALTPNHQ